MTAASSLPNSSWISIRCFSTAKSVRRSPASHLRNWQTSVRVAAWCPPTSSAESEPQKGTSGTNWFSRGLYFYVPFVPFCGYNQFMVEDERRNYDRARLIVDVFFDG